MPIAQTAQPKVDKIEDIKQFPSRNQNEVVTVEGVVLHYVAATFNQPTVLEFIAKI